MSWNETRRINVAVLDMNCGLENQGMRCIKDIVTQWAIRNNYVLNMKEFEVRVKQELPGTDFDVYISSGGPGSPLESEGAEWENRFFEWLHQMEDWNNGDAFPKKHAFFICHSFQLVSRHYKIGNVCRRKSTSFGVFPIHRLDNQEESIFEGLKDPFYAVDSRDYQLISPDLQRINEMGATLLAMEKERMHVPYERAVMAVRFNDYFVGTQFHPEADAQGMSMYLQRDDKKKMVIENHGETKWAGMLEQLNDPRKILSTYNLILPNFLNQAVLALEKGVITAVA